MKTEKKQTKSETFYSFWCLYIGEVYLWNRDYRLRFYTEAP